MYDYWSSSTTVRSCISGRWLGTRNHPSHWGHFSPPQQQQQQHPPHTPQQHQQKQQQQQQQRQSPFQPTHYQSHTINPSYY